MASRSEENSKLDAVRRPTDCAKWSMQLLTRTQQSRYFVKLFFGPCTVDYSQETSPLMAPPPPTATSTDDELCVFAMQLVGSVTLPMTLTAAVKLGVLEILAAAATSEGLTAAEVAAQLSAEATRAPPMLERMLRLLAAHGVLTSAEKEDGVRRYKAAAVVRWLTKNDDGVSLAPMALLANSKVFIDSWQQMAEAVVEGVVPFDRAHGGLNAFEYQGVDQQFNRLFNHAMKNNSAIITAKLADLYHGFDGIHVLVDIGGGVGVTLQTIVARHPRIKGINFDLPHVIADAPDVPGVEHVVGDMFEGVPSGGDAILMKYILHDWSDEQCIKVLKNCWRALPAGGKVLVIESLIYPSVETAPLHVLQSDMIMLTVNPGGKERTEKQFEELARNAGFAQLNKTYVFASVWVMELSK